MNEFLATLPSTNFRILITMVLYVITIVNVNVCIFFGKPMSLDVLLAMFAFLGAMAGIDYVQFGKKRDTYQPAPPDVEDAKALANTPATTRRKNAAKKTQRHRS